MMIASTEKLVTHAANEGGFVFNIIRNKILLFQTKYILRNLANKINHFANVDMST